MKKLLFLFLFLLLFAPLCEGQFVKAVRTEPFSLSTKDFRPIPFESNETRMNDVSLHDPRTSLTRFTAASDGAFLVFGTIIYEKQAGGYIRNLCLIKNSDEVTGVLGCNALTSPNDCFAYEGCSVAVAPTMVFLSAGEYVEFYGYQDTGKPVAIRYGPVAASSYAVMIRLSAGAPALTASR